LPLATPLIALPSGKEEESPQPVEEIDDAEVPEDESHMDLDEPEQNPSTTTIEEEPVLHTARECYICKVNYWEVHHFYDKVFVLLFT
jgi:hypothetical protein